MQELRVHNLPSQIAEAELSGRTVVVIDLLRASSTICQALAAGATEVVPFLEVEDAVAAAADDRAKVILGGERGGLRIDRFDLGNSPSEYTQDTVGGKRVFLTTTNGTRALHHARLARRVLVGSLLNLSALVESLREEPRVDIICAGTQGVESREDILAAGAIVEQLVARDRGAWQLDEAATVALAEWRCRGEDLAVELRSTPGGANLLSIGMDRDLVDCARVDALRIVPELDVSTGRITLP